MAAPKVFVSSTCFDLGEIREQLKRFILNYGFEAILSENGDVFYHPDLHTHESCLNEVSNCQMFILIIGGRFGGEYIADRSKSITNAEYLAARNSGIPVFTYVRSGVLSNHHVYQQNKKKDFALEIDYPAIEKQEYAADIFGFIDDIRKSPLNNAIEGFDGFSDIENHLRKQWAGLFYELLRAREVKSQIDATNHLIEGISASSKKLEELIKSLYISSNKVEAEKEITLIDIYSSTLEFFDRAVFPQWAKKNQFLIDSLNFNPSNMSAVSPEGHSWHSYLVKIGIFKYNTIQIGDDKESPTEIVEFAISSEKNRTFFFNINEKELQHLFESGVLKSTRDQRLKALKEIDKKYGDIPF